MVLVVSLVAQVPRYIATALDWEKRDASSGTYKEKGSEYHGTETE